MSVTDLVTLSVLQAITPSLREAVSAIARGDRKGMYSLQSVKYVSFYCRERIPIIDTVPDVNQNIVMDSSELL